MIFYFFSNLLGAIVFGLAGNISFGEVTDFAIDTYLQGEYISSKNEIKYWFLVFLPFVLFPILLLNFNIVSLRPRWILSTSVNSESYILTLLVICFLFFTEIYTSNNIGILTLSHLSDSKDNYSEYILGRTDYFSSLSNRFFGYLYMTMPFLTHIAIFKFFKSKKKFFWLGTSIFLILVIVLISIGINQKAPLIIFFISLLIGISLIKKVSYFVYIFAFIFIILVVNVIQIFVIGDDGWDLISSFFHILFRAPSAIPYYVNYYPDKFAFVGPDFGISALFHISSYEALDNIDIHTVIWGQSFENLGILGSVAAPFHFRAYAQAGLVFAIFNLFFVALFIRLLSWLYVNKILGDAALSHGFYTQSIIVLYYLSQTHIKDCLWSSYGIVWIFHGILILLMLSILNTGIVLLKTRSLLNKRV